MLPDVAIVDKLRILGVTFNSNWNFDDHVNRTISMASRRLYAMRVLIKPSFSNDEMILVYNTLVRSLFEYSLSFGDPLRVTKANSIDYKSAFIVSFVENYGTVSYTHLTLPTILLV